MRFTRREFTRAAAVGASALALPACASRPRAAAAGAGESAGASRQALRILVLGGTRFLGVDVVRAALARAHRVTIFHRGKTNPGMFGRDVEELFGDRDGKLDALRGRDFEAVVDTSGYVPRVVRQSASLLAPKVGRYLFVSSISVYGEPIPAGSAEDAPLARLADPASEDVAKDYGALKAACERVVAEALPGRALLVRPGLIVGPNDPTDRFTYWPVRLARGGEALAPGDGQDPVQVVDVRDLAAFLIRLLEAQATGALNATGPARPLAMKDFLAQVGAGVGGDARLTWVDTAFLEAQGVKPWEDVPAWVPRAEDGTLAVSVARALERGLAFRPLADTARDTLAWWRTLPEERRAKPKAGLSAAREAEVLAAWHARR